MEPPAVPSQGREASANPAQRWSGQRALLTGEPPEPQRPEFSPGSITWARLTPTSAPSRGCADPT